MLVLPPMLSGSIAEVHLARTLDGILYRIFCLLSGLSTVILKQYVNVNLAY